MLQLVVLLLFIRFMSAAIKYLWALLLWIQSPESIGVKKDYNYSPQVSILLPCFNEGRVVYDTMESISKSCYPNFEIIAVDDCSKDDSFAWMEKAAQDFPNIRVIKNAVNMGKNRSQMVAFRQSAGDIIICIDSDCIFATNTIRELVACLADPTLGAVGGQVGIKNVNDNVVTKYQTFMYYLGFHLAKIPENWTRTIVCISGCLFATRRTILKELEPILENRNWFGIPVAEGEDRFMTHQILLRGLGTYINLDARCWTDVPNTVRKYFMQQLRWRRSAIRDIFYTLRVLPRQLRVAHLNATYSILVPAFSIIFGVVAILFAPKYDPLFWMNPTAWAVYIGMASVLSIAIKRSNPEQKIEGPIVALLGFGAWWVVSRLFITILALCTLDAPDWGTRAKKIGGSI